MCVCVYMYVCMCVCVYVCLCTYVCVCVYVHMCVCVYAHVCMCMCTCVYIYVRMCICVLHDCFANCFYYWFLGKSDKSSLWPWAQTLTHSLWLTILQVRITRGFLCMCVEQNPKSQSVCDDLMREAMLNLLYAASQKILIKRRAPDGETEWTQR